MEKFVITKIRDGAIEACVGPFDSVESARSYLLAEGWEFHNCGQLRDLGKPTAGHYTKDVGFLAIVHPLIEA